MNVPERARQRAARPTWPRLVMLLSLNLAVLAGCALPAKQAQLPTASDRQAAAPGSSHGIRVDGLRLSAHGYLLDLRFRVLDPGKAAPLLDAKKKVQLIDRARHARLGVPESPVIGGMRQTSRNHVVYTDRDYFVLFVNPGRAVQAGETLDLAVDGVKFAQVTVE